MNTTHERLRLELKGQIPSGKNAIQLRPIVAKSGRSFVQKYPNKRFVQWRTDALKQLALQIPTDYRTITTPVDITITYTASDLRRRDAPGMIDALWHLLEKADVVADDTLLGGHGKSVTFINQGKSKGNEGVVLDIL